MKQYALFDAPESQDNKYTKKIATPVYEPNHTKPHLLSLFDDSKTHRLIRDILGSDVPVEEKEFLIAAARRHTVFNYEQIADYYAHSNPEMQQLMERSALVLIDFNDAIAYGYVQLCDMIKNQFLTEYEPLPEVSGSTVILDNNTVLEIDWDKEKQEPLNESTDDNQQ